MKNVRKAPAHVPSAGTPPIDNHANPTYYAKAIIGALIAVAGALATAADGGLTLAEVLTAVVAGLVALGAVYGVPNRRG